MNNDQFRRLAFDKPETSSSTAPPAANGRPAAGATPALGSRQRSSIPMTPRSVAGHSGIDFARQLREQQREASSSSHPPSAKKPRTAAPKGSKLAAGYVDRSAQRRAADAPAPADEDAPAGRTAGADRAAHARSLEDKLRGLDAELAAGRLALEDYARARGALVGGDVGSVHLVQGLDRRLLARVRRGEDVLGGDADAGSTGPARLGADGEDGREAEGPVDVDAELEALEVRDVAPREREVREKKGIMAPPPPPPPQAGRKRTRDEILRDLKAARAAAKNGGARTDEAAKAEPALGARFKKVGALPAPGQARIERDDKGREVLITVDAEGRVKRKVRRARAAEGNGLLVPDAGAAPLGADAVVPERPVEEAVEEEEGDIFEGVGAEYDPLGDEEDSASGSASEEDAEDGEVPERPSRPPPPNESVAAPPTSTGPTEPSGAAPSGPRNYFGSTDTTDVDDATAPTNPLQDPTIMAALKRAAAIAQPDKTDADAKASARSTVQDRAAMLDRDDADMDMGFGSSRMDDDEDEEGFKGKLAAWGDEEGEGGEKRGGQQRKRGKKKRKGDKDSAKDVLAVLERRAKEGR